MRPLSSYAARDLTIVDDFYPDPFSVRQRFLDDHEQFVVLADENYPGRTLLTAGDLVERNLPRLEELAGVPLRLSNHSVRSATADEWPARLSTVHLDDVPFTFIIYMGIVDTENPYKEYPEYGTVLFSHKQTGFDRIFRDNDEGYAEFLKAHGLSAEAYASVRARMIDDLADTSCWQAEAVIPYRFNRIVIQRANVMFHSGPSSSFGTTVETARITENYFMRYDGLRLLAREAERQRR